MTIVDGIGILSVLGVLALLTLITGLVLQSSAAIRDALRGVPRAQVSRTPPRWISSAPARAA